MSAHLTRPVRQQRESICAPDLRRGLPHPELEGRLMPVFDRFSSQPMQTEAEFLRGVLGPPKDRVTSLRVASRAYRRRQRRAMLGRALIVATLAACFCGSAFMTSGNNSLRRPQTARVLPADFDPVTTGSVAVTSDPCRGRLRDASMRSDACASRKPQADEM